MVAAQYPVAAQKRIEIDQVDRFSPEKVDRALDGSFDRAVCVQQHGLVLLA
jgi:hypothetical protein